MLGMSAVEYHEAKMAKDVCMDFGIYENTGFRPIGVKQILTECGLDALRLFLKSRCLLANGVLVFREKVATKSVNSAICAIDAVYPRIDDRKHIGILTYEGVNFRSYTAVGDDCDLAKFWSMQWRAEEAVRCLDVLGKGVFWTGGIKGMHFIPYLDFDELGLEGDFSRIWSTRVEPCILIVAAIISGAYQIFFNYRKTATDGLWKYSFHVHFFESVVENIQQLKTKLASLPDIPRKSNWTRTDGGWTVEMDPRKPMYDTAVYGGHNQLFRGPYCGKAGNLSAVLLPLKIIEEGDGVFSFVEDTALPCEEYILRARIAVYPTIQIPHAFEEKTVKIHQSTVVGRVPCIDPVDSMWEFFRPLVLNLLIPRWQTFRYNVMVSKAGVRGAVVPTENLEIMSNRAHESKKNTRLVQIKGDTFCMMDEKSFHSKSPHAIGLQIDLARCTIAQNCFACGTKSEKFNFLHGNEEIYIKAVCESEFTFTDCIFPVSVPHDFLLNYFEDLFRMHRSSNTVWVFDESQKIWSCGPNGNMIIGKLVDSLNQLYRRYLHSHQDFHLRRKIAKFLQNNEGLSEDSPAYVKFCDESKKSARAFMAKHKTFCTLNAVGRGKIIDELKNFNVKREVVDFNPFPNLVPMKNGTCLNIFNMDITEIRDSHYFTTLLDAELTTNQGDLDDVNEFFNEVSAGDLEKREYLALIAGYMMTFMIHDRKFYVFRGSGKNAKGLFKEFLIQILNGPANCDQCWKSLGQNFWEKRANANQSAEAPSPETFGLSNKTLFYTDDIDRVLIDAVKVKRYVAGEKVSGRALHAMPVTITPRGKILWTTNHYPDLPGNDNAVWERYVQVDFLAKYVEKKDEVDASRFRYLQNYARYLDLLTKKDAFFSICMKNLNAYYRSLPFDPVTLEPTVLTSFPVPQSMEMSKTLARSQQLPLAAFMMNHTVVDTQPLSFVTVDELFQDYMTFLENVNERKVRNETTQTSFIRLLSTALDISCVAGLVVGRCISSHVVASKKRGEYVSADRDFSDEYPVRKSRY